MHGYSYTPGPRTGTHDTLSTILFYVHKHLSCTCGSYSSNKHTVSIYPTPRIFSPFCHFHRLTSPPPARRFISAFYIALIVCASMLPKRHSSTAYPLHPPSPPLPFIHLCIALPTPTHCSPHAACPFSPQGDALSTYSMYTASPHLPQTIPFPGS